MKVVTAKQMSELESRAYEEGASESDFMEEAGSGVALVVHDYAEKNNVDRQIVLLCGKGNNAGDAYTAGIHLLHLDYEVTAYQTFPINDCSTLCRENYLLFIQDGGRVKEITSADDITFPNSGIIVDGLFGTGFHGKVDEPFASIIRAANESSLPIIAVDIPSGLNGTTGEANSTTIVAATTAFLGLPKTGFFLRDGWNHVGKLAFVDFGLQKEIIESAQTEIELMSPDIMRPMMPKMKRNRHKYEAGQVVALSGSPTMPGAALLGTFASLCGGAGIVRLLYTEEMELSLVASPYEVIKVPYDKSKEGMKQALEWLNKGNAVFIGPGIGLTQEMRDLLKYVLPKLEKPCVLDADALTIIAEEKIAFPKQAVLTPHIGEMKRLLKTDDFQVDMEHIHLCKKYVEKNKVTLVLKGGPTFVMHPKEVIMVNAHGDPGMATAGSGDVLTGLIASLLAQGLPPFAAAQLGVYLHAIAGEYAAEDFTSYCMTASDIISAFPDAFRSQNWTV